MKYALSHNDSLTIAEVGLIFNQLLNHRVVQEKEIKTSAKGILHNLSESKRLNI